MTDSRLAGILPTTSSLSFANFWDHTQARFGWKRMRHIVQPGLYALGSPNPDSPVFVTANYTLSFDALRSALPGWDAFILVLDTKGVNVWCAAGEHTFGTAELVSRIVDRARIRGIGPESDVLDCAIFMRGVFARFGHRSRRD